MSLYQYLKRVTHTKQIIIEELLLKDVYKNIYTTLTDPQFGFRQGVRRVNSIFFTSKYHREALSNNKKIYCCIVDYRIAFDIVNRNFLFKKLINIGIGRKMFQSILSLCMYKNVRSCVKYENNFMEFFNVEHGVLQSPLHFSFE